jgi:hypothetical protein
MRRLALACAASVVLYALAFGWVLDQRLETAYLRGLIEAKLARGAAIRTPKLVILAGSNALYSHRCETIEPMLALPCVNAGVAVGIGLDYLFARWDQLLRAGDVVYMPMEATQYTRTRAATETGPEGAIMFRHNHALLLSLGPRRVLAGLFAFDLRAAVISVIQLALPGTALSDTRALLAADTNEWGDRIGHTAERALANRDAVLHLPPTRVSAAAIAQGYGTALIADFVARMSARGVRVVGGLPTGFADDAPDPAAIAAMRAVYVDNGGAFLVLPGQSRYPRLCFYDTADHLFEACQVHHSIRVANGLAAVLGRPIAATRDDPGCSEATAAR